MAAKADELEKQAKAILGNRDSSYRCRIAAAVIVDLIEAGYPQDARAVAKTLIENPE